jgi:hypothetical protein
MVPYVHVDPRDVLIALVAVLMALVLSRWIREWRGSWRARRRAVRAGDGEDRALDLLEEAGFVVLERQARVTWAPLVDGVPQHLELRADYIVECGRELLVAEVKTGDEAPSIDTAATRRQLLEYHVAFGVDGVLLVSPERGTVQRVVFPTLR